MVWRSARSCLASEQGGRLRRAGYSEPSAVCRAAASRWSAGISLLYVLVVRLI
jgi:hypothetical protein